MPQMLVGRYRFIEKIGAGGFGVVSKFYDVLTDEEVAVKTIPAYYVNCESKRLIRELDILIFLYNAHPHVIGYYNMFATRVSSHSYKSRNWFSACNNNNNNNNSLFDVQYNKNNNGCNANNRYNAHQNLPTRLEDYIITEDVDDVPMELNVYGPLYSSLSTSAKICLHQNKLNEMVRSIDRREEFNVHIVMPLMKGDLLQFISLSSPNSMLRATEGLTSKALSAISVVFAFQVCFGLDFLHKSHVLHRDMKPDNILVRVDAKNVYMSSALIIDLGLARDAQESDTFYICTRYYRPPEMITNSSKGSPAIDIWSLGCIFYEMCTGHILFSLGTALRNGVWDGLKASEQLEEILKKLGTPSIADVQRYMPEGNAKLYLLRSQQRPCRLRELMLEKWRLEMSIKEQQLWIDLTARCLAFFPQQRPSAEELCCHELFRRINIKYNENIFQYKTQPYRPTFRDSALSNKAWIENKNKILTLTTHALQLAIPTDIDEDDNNEAMEDDEQSTNTIAKESEYTSPVNNNNNANAPHRVNITNNSENVNQFKSNVKEVPSDNVNVRSLSPFSSNSSEAQQEQHEEEQWELLREQEEQQQEQFQHPEEEEKVEEEEEEEEQEYQEQMREEYKLLLSEQQKQYEVQMLSAECLDNFVNNSSPLNNEQTESCADKNNANKSKWNNESEVTAKPTEFTLTENKANQLYTKTVMVDEDHKINVDNNDNRYYNNENDNDQISLREYVLDIAADNGNINAVDNKCTHNRMLHEESRLPDITSEYQFTVKEDEEDYNNDYVQVKNYYSSANNNNEVVLPKVQKTQAKLEVLNTVNAMENSRQQQDIHKHNTLEKPMQPPSSTSTYFTTNHVPLPEAHMTDITTDNNNIYSAQPYSEITGHKQINDNVATVVPPPPPQNNNTNNNINNVQANTHNNNIYGETQRNVEIQQQHAPPVEHQPQTTNQCTSQQVTLTPLVWPLQNPEDHEGYNKQQNSDLYQQYSHTSMFSPLFMSNTSSAMLYNYNNSELNNFSSFRDDYTRNNSNINNNNFYNNYSTNDNNSSNYFYTGSNEGMNTSYYQCSPHNTFSVNNTEINSKRSRHEPGADSFSHQYSSVYSYSVPTSSQMACLNNTESTTTASTTTNKAATTVASFPFSQFEDAQLWQYYEPLSRSANGVQNAITTILEDLTTCRHDAARSNRLRELLRYFNNLQNADEANNTSASANTTLEATTQPT